MKSPGKSSVGSKPPKSRALGRKTVAVHSERMEMLPVLRNKDIKDIVKQLEKEVWLFFVCLFVCLFVW